MFAATNAIRQCYNPAAHHGNGQKRQVRGNWRLPSSCPDLWHISLAYLRSVVALGSHLHPCYLNRDKLHHQGKSHNSPEASATCKISCAPVQISSKKMLVLSPAVSVLCSSKILVTPVLLQCQANLRGHTKLPAQQRLCFSKWDANNRGLITWHITALGNVSWSNLSPNPDGRCCKNRQELELANCARDLGDCRKSSQSFWLRVQLQHRRQTGCQLHW